MPTFILSFTTSSTQTANRNFFKYSEHKQTEPHTSTAIANNNQFLHTESTQREKILKKKIYYNFLLKQNEFNIGLDLSEARASLLSGDVVELTNATSTEPTSMKLVWEVKCFYELINLHRIHPGVR